MSNSIIIASEIVRNKIDISQFTRDVQIRLQDAIFKLGQEARDMARRDCPVKTGALRASIYVSRPGSKADQAAGVIGKRATAGYVAAVKKATSLAEDAVIIRALNKIDNAHKLSSAKNIMAQLNANAIASLQGHHYDPNEMINRMRDMALDDARDKILIEATSKASLALQEDTSAFDPHTQKYIGNTKKITNTLHDAIVNLGYEPGDPMYHDMMKAAMTQDHRLNPDYMKKINTGESFGPFKYKGFKNDKRTILPFSELANNADTAYVVLGVAAYYAGYVVYGHGDVYPNDFFTPAVNWAGRQLEGRIRSVIGNDMKIPYVG